MKFHELEVSAHKSAKRAGRGIAAGRGKTAGRGTKGQNSRTGSSRKPGFEGGQNPLMQRLPKLRGFRSLRLKAEIVSTGQLETLGKKAVTTKELAEAGLISSEYTIVKVVVNGEIKKAMDVRLQGASQTAIDAIQKAGGSFEKVARPARPKTAAK